MSRTVEQHRGVARPIADADKCVIAPGVAARQRGNGTGEKTGQAEVRCECGSLMARLVGNRLELKCRRCKRVVFIATDLASRGWVTVPSGGCGP